MIIGKREFIDGTRLTDVERREVLGSLTSAAPPKEGEKRQQTRYSYTTANVPVTIQHSRNGKDACFLMHGRNLSSGGISLLHGGFLHKGTTCRLVLIRNDGTAQVVLGNVVSCRYITRNIHEVNIQFSAKIEVLQFCEPGTEIKPNASSIDVPRHSGLALCLCGHDVNRRHLAALLSRTGLEVMEVKTLGEAADRLKRLPFSLVLVDSEGAEWYVPQAVDQCRDAGFNGRIVTIGDDQQRSDASFTRPVDDKHFIRTVSMLDLESAGPGEQRIYSTLAGDPKTRGLLPAFVEQAREMARTLERAMCHDDRAAIISACQSLKSVAGGYGFGEVGKAASNALAAVERAKDLGEAGREIGIVTSLCRRLCAEEPPASKAA